MLICPLSSKFASFKVLFLGIVSGLTGTHLYAVSSHWNFHTGYTCASAIFVCFERMCVNLELSLLDFSQRTLPSVPKCAQVRQGCWNIGGMHNPEWTGHHQKVNYVKLSSSFKITKRERECIFLAYTIQPTKKTNYTGFPSQLSTCAERNEDKSWDPVSRISVSLSTVCIIHSGFSLK